MDVQLSNANYHDLMKNHINMATRKLTCSQWMSCCWAGRYCHLHITFCKRAFYALVSASSSCVDMIVGLTVFWLDDGYVVICGGVGISHMYNHVAAYARVSNTETKLSSKVITQVAESTWQVFRAYSPLELRACRLGSLLHLGIQANSEDWAVVCSWVWVDEAELAAQTSARVIIPGNRPTNVENPITDVQTTVGTAKTSGNVVQTSRGPDEGRISSVFPLSVKLVLPNKISLSFHVSMGILVILFFASLFKLHFDMYQNHKWYTRRIASELSVPAVWC